MRALSVRQPWAWAIIHAGKDVENRACRTNHRGPLAIHATKCSRAEYEQAAERIRAICGTSPPPYEVARATFGHVVGTVDVVGSRSEDFDEKAPDSPWADDFCAWWLLESPRPCQPFPARGSLGLFSVSDDLIS